MQYDIFFIFLLTRTWRVWHFWKWLNTRILWSRTTLLQKHII